MARWVLWLISIQRSVNKDVVFHLRLVNFNKNLLGRLITCRGKPMNVLHIMPCPFHLRKCAGMLQCTLYVTTK